MRQIKFRGKDNHGEWHYGGITADKRFIASHFTFQSVRPETVGQFTGFLDSAETEIYEEDVVLINDIPYVVKWLDKNGQFIFENNAVLISMLNSYNCKVVGNIHDDANLFKRFSK